MAFFDQFVFYKSEIIRQTAVAIRATFTITKTFRVTKRSTSGPRFIKDQCKVKLRTGLLSDGAKFESTMAESFELEVSYSG